MSADRELFTVDGGYVLFDPRGERVRFACSVRPTGNPADVTDEAVLLEKGECLKIGLMLLQSVLSTDEQALLRAIVSIAEHRIHGPVAP